MTRRIYGYLTKDEATFADTQQTASWLTQDKRDASVEVHLRDLREGVHEGVRFLCGEKEADHAVVKSITESRRSWPHCQGCLGEIATRLARSQGPLLLTGAEIDTFFEGYLGENDQLRVVLFEGEEVSHLRGLDHPRILACHDQEAAKKVVRFAGGLHAIPALQAGAVCRLCATEVTRRKEERFWRKVERASTIEWGATAECRLFADLFGLAIVTEIEEQPDGSTPPEQPWLRHLGLRRAGGGLAMFCSHKIVTRTTAHAFADRSFENPMPITCSECIDGASAMHLAERTSAVVMLAMAEARHDASAMTIVNRYLSRKN